jgi:hypothetical protein
MRKFVLLAIVVFAILMLAAVAGAQEPAGISVTGLEEGETFEVEFATTADGQLFAFNGSEGDEVTITMEQDGNTPLDPLLILLGERGQVIAYNDDSSNSDLEVLAAEIEDVELPYDGSYYVFATTFMGLRDSTAGDDSDEPYVFELTASGFSEPSGVEDDSFAWAGIQAEIGGGGTLQVTEEEPVYYVSFEAEEGDVVSITTEAGDVGDTILYLFDPNGIMVASNDDADSLMAALEGIELEEDGTYLIFATAFGFTSAPDDGFTNTGTFDLLIEASEGGASK